jgi:hypothetical protein
VNASEILDGLAALPGARDSGADGNGIIASRLLNGIEYARASAVEETKLRSSWKRRQGGGATPLVLVADDPEQPGYVRVIAVGSPGASQLPAPTDPGVTVSRHRALLTGLSVRADPPPVGEQAGLSFE